MKIVSMPIKQNWFNMILAEVKKEEYRTVGDYWRKRLLSDKVDAIKLINGYGNDKPYLVVELKDIKKGVGKEEWGATKEEVYILELGKIIKTGNIKREICFLCDRTDYGSFLMPYNGYCPIECCIDSCKRYLEKTTTLL